jgi:hypothetical protein
MPEEDEEELLRTMNGNVAYADGCTDSRHPRPRRAKPRGTERRYGGRKRWRISQF